MVTSFLQLNHSLAVVASLPALLLGHLHHTSGVVVLWTFPSCVVLAVTTNTYFGVASTTPTIFSSGSHIDLDLAWLDPFTAAFRRAIKVFRSGVLFELLVPEPLEFIIE